ncbi:DNA-binding transcriptional regulator, MarR family [Monaibacterium marinum]|uniref:DNA-binding transcriptional regulator, MarR family n=1 Tax=Pontivivens marinum TaxID=1690039 RepID=A0A2C9CWZ3_9RHOB|nr:MarR family transcriptional regulator [Monaibacterium marinum]SOH94959.1 DNA-binding transcriptional regulator, MarR family [Monaibacterium marinum]
MMNSSEQPEHHYDLDTQIGFRLRLAMQRHAEIFFNVMETGLTQAQYATLARLYLVGSCSQNQLGRSVALDSASIVGVVNRLKASGLLTRTRDEVDRRRMIISLTDEGRALVERVIPLAKQANEATLAKLDTAERMMLVHLLNKLTADDS